MYYLFQLGTNMFFYGCFYFFELFVMLLCHHLNIPIATTETIFLVSISVITCILAIISKISTFLYHHHISAPTFHPLSTLRQRIANTTLYILALLYIIMLVFCLIFPPIKHCVFIISNILSTTALGISILNSLFMESLPDKDDTLLFSDENIYYYMRVKKGIKNNRYMNSYIIPYDSIIRSYIFKNILFIEFNRNHKGLKISRQFSTFSKRLQINLRDYPNLKKYILSPENSVKIKLKPLKNIEMSDYI